MRRFRRDPSVPSQLRRTRVGPMPWSIQKRGILDKYPSGVIIEEKSERTKQKFPTFELSELVLDLDAEDSPYVRPFDYRDATQQQSVWGRKPAIKEAAELQLRVGKLRKDIVRDAKMMHHQTSRPNSMQNISDYDVLAVALLGGSAVSTSLEDSSPRDEQSQRHRPITLGSLRQNGIPERVLAGDANKVILFMLHRQQLTRTKEDTGDLEAFTASLRHVQGLSQLRKLCSGRTVVPKQILTSQTTIDVIVHRLRSMPPQPLQDVLKFVNNFTIRQLSESAGPNASMSLYGLEVASKLNLLPPILQYLQICLFQGFIGKDDQNTETLETVGRGMLVALERGQGRARGTRPEVFTLLTGRSLDGSEPQSGLYGVYRLQREEHPRVHLIYVRLLAELGALRLLWYAWRGDLETVGDTAFVRCAEVLSSADGDASVDYMTVTGDLKKDADLDLRTIDSLDAYVTSAMSTRASYSSNFEGLISPSEIRQAYESTDIHQAMIRFQELISRAAAVTRSE